MKLYEKSSLKRLLVLTGALLILIAVFASLPHRQTMPVNTDPQTLYHLAWEVTGQTFYDTQKLSEWKSWEHKFDGKLKSDQDAVKAINEMLASLNDHFTFFEGKAQATAELQSRKGSFVGIGVAIGRDVIQDGKPHVSPNFEVYPPTDTNGYALIQGVLEGGPSEKAGLKAGDAIVTVTDLAKADAKPFDTRGQTVNALVAAIKGEAGTKVKLTVSREGKTFEVTLTRAPVARLSVTYKMLPDNIGYIQIRGFDTENMLQQLAQALDALKGSRGLIIDLRNNPGGMVQNAINGAAMFLDRGTIVTMKSRGEGRFTEEQIVLADKYIGVVALDGNKTSIAKFPRPSQRTKVPVVILVNENSASASEMFAGALQDNGRAVVVGVKSVGKGIGQSVIPMPNGTMLHVTSLRYYTPNHTWVGDAMRGHFATGIRPDVVVPLDRQAKGDNQLDAATAKLSSLIAGKK